MQLHNKIAGRYKIEKVINAGSVLEYKIPVTGWFDNLITNKGLDFFGVQTTGLPGYLGTCMVGSSNTTPQVTDLALGSLLGSVNGHLSSTSSNSSSPDYYRRIVLTYRLVAGVGTGNISEVGVGLSSTSGDIFSRALILDGSGNPTTITKLSDEILDITYDFRVYPVLTDFTGGFTLSGNKGGAYTYTGRVADVGSIMQDISGYPYTLLYGGPGITAYNGSMGSITGSPAGTSSGGTSTIPTYINGTYNTNFTMTFSVSQGNLSGGIKSIKVAGTQMRWQFEFNNAIPKTASDTLSMTGNISWGRY